jgi:DNA-binding transcriptional regulator YhcF (GntR family)
MHGAIGMSEPSSTPAREPHDLRAHDLVRLIEGQIRTGLYSAGARLPTVRELAQRYHVNKNTAARAYQTLEQRGIIDMARGRGAFVTTSPEGILAWQQRIEQLVRDARQHGVNRVQLLKTFGQLVGQIYGQTTPRALFIECNRQDLETLGSELSTITGVTLDLMLLENAIRNADSLATHYDLLITTFQHLGQLRQAMPATVRDQVVGVHVTPTHDSLLELARLHVTACALICDTPSTIASLTHLISIYNPALHVAPALIDDQAQVEHVVAQAAAIIVTRSCRQALGSLTLTQPVVIVTFTIDQQSIDFLCSRIRELQELQIGVSSTQESPK